jgi:hypothetical protein
MTEEDNILLALLGGAGALLLAFLGMQKPSTTASASTATVATPKAKTGCGCGR